MGRKDVLPEMCIVVLRSEVFPVLQNHCNFNLRELEVSNYCTQDYDGVRSLI